MTSLFPPDSPWRRAEFLQAFEALLRQWEPDFPAPTKKSATPLDQLLPRIRVSRQHVVCNGLILDLARRPLTLRLFEVFCDAPDYQLARNDMLSLVYRVSDFAGRSDRYTEAVYNNGVKLISRARILAATHLSPAVRHGIEWFVYDQERKIWCLYRLRHEYLSEHLS